MWGNDSNVFASVSSNASRHFKQHQTYFVSPTNSNDMMFVLPDGYTTDTLRFKWDENPIDKSNDFEIPQFTLDGLQCSQCDKMYYGGKPRPFP